MTHTLLTPTEVAEHLGVPKDTLAQWRWRQIGPAFLRVGRHVRYDEGDVDKWLAANRHGGDAA